MCPWRVRMDNSQDIPLSDKPMRYSRQSINIMLVPRASSPSMVSPALARQKVKLPRSDSPRLVNSLVWDHDNLTTQIPDIPYPLPRLMLFSPALVSMNNNTFQRTVILYSTNSNNFPRHTRLGACPPSSLIQAIAIASTLTVTVTTAAAAATATATSRC